MAWQPHVRSLCLILALAFIAHQGMVVRRLSTQTYLWSGPRATSPLRLPIAVPREALQAPSWSAILNRLDDVPPDPRMRDVALLGVTTVDRLGEAYTAVLDVLTPAQARAVAAPQTELVDCMFAGLLADRHPPITYAYLALRGGLDEASPAAEPRGRVDGPSGGWAQDGAFPPPSQLFWGITQCAQGPDASLTVDQRKALLAALDVLADRTGAYHAVRASLSRYLRMPAEQRQHGPPPSPFPMQQELVRVKAALVKLTAQQPQ